MTLAQQILTIAICALATMATRFLPFLVFHEGRPTPPLVIYLGKALPSAIFAMLVVYSLRNVDVFGQSHGLPESSLLWRCISGNDRCLFPSLAAPCATCCSCSSFSKIAA